MYNFNYGVLEVINDFIQKTFKNSYNTYNKKVSIIGMGYVGAGIAYALMIKDIAREIAFIDVKKEAVNAEMLDIRHGMVNMGSAKIKAGTYEDIKNSDLIIVTAGRGRKAGESRLDLIDDNIKISDQVIKNIKKYYKQGVILIVTNPVDIITYYFDKKLKLPKGTVFGTGCILDSSRLKNVIADYVDLEPEFVSATVIGEHGQNQIPLWSSVQVAGLPIEKYCKEVGIDFDENVKSGMGDKVLNMGAEIISGKGKTYYGISTCVCFIADAILNKRAVTASVTSVLNKTCGADNIALSLPSIIDHTGIKRTLEPEMSTKESKLFKNAVTSISTFVKKVSEKYNV